MHEESSSQMNWHQNLNSLKVFGMCWRRLYRELDSCVVNTRSWPINVLVKILYWQCKSPALCKSYSTHSIS